ncbi:U3 small nucleolar RNA-associated protein 6 homolog [Linum perenne]
MADTVQYRLERMVEELDDLERRGLFTRPEIREIVKQRRKFEYRLKRPSPLKQDYLTYIEYETQVDTLRRLRKKSMARDKKENKKMKLSVSDFTGVSRIMEIYRLAVMRYKGDVDLWIRYLEFCRERKNGRMKKVLAQLIRFHPKVSGVWIYAAAWEFDQNLNVEAARALMQSGLRVCPTSEDLWVEYLRMELTYLNKLKARKVALGEDHGTLVRQDGGDDEKQWRDENKDLFMSLDDDEEKNHDESNTDNDDSEKKVDLFREQGLNILRAVYSGAVEALPSSFSLRLRLLEILEATDLAHSEDMREQILCDMKRDFSKDPKYWEWLARLEVSDSKSNQGLIDDAMLEQLQKAAKVYEEALEVLPSPVMFNLYTKFLMDIVVPKDENTQLSACTQDWISRLLAVYEKAELVGSMSEDLACDYVSFYLHLGKFDKARQLAGELCCGELSNSAKLWCLRASMEIRCVTENILSQTKASLDSVFGLMREALSKVPLSESEELWLMALKFFVLEKDYFDKLVEMSITAVAKSGGSDCGFALSSAVVNFILHKDGIQNARKLYERFLALPRPGLSLYTRCIELEQSLASVGNKECLVIARKLYESALSTYDQNLSLWRDFYSMEIKLGTPETANAVHWRARKTLKDQAAATLVASPDVL